MDPYSLPVGMECSTCTPDGCHLYVSESSAAFYETFWVGL